jgi:hypothetical protein
VESEADIYNRSQLKLSGYQKKKKTRVWSRELKKN